MANKLYVANAIIKKKFKNNEEEAERLLFYVVIEKTEKENFFSYIAMRHRRWLLASFATKEISFVVKIVWKILTI